MKQAIYINIALNINININIERRIKMNIIAGEWKRMSREEKINKILDVVVDNYWKQKERY